MNELAEKLANLTKWQTEYPCDSCKSHWDCEHCERLKKWQSRRRKNENSIKND